MERLPIPTDEELEAALKERGLSRETFDVTDFWAEWLLSKASETEVDEFVVKVLPEFKLEEMALFVSRLLANGREWIGIRTCERLKHKTDA